jgi:hypothetical protein
MMASEISDENGFSGAGRIAISPAFTPFSISPGICSAIVVPRSVPASKAV